MPLRIEGVRIAGSAAAVDVSRQGWRVEGLPQGLKLIRHARNPLTAIRQAPADQLNRRPLTANHGPPPVAEVSAGIGLGRSFRRLGTGKKMPPGVGRAE